ncbi:hypothetical protein SeLEV6574_g06278 [Synchytrium endobioticum]|nr:hypothetical protein SeLEV6574_g06278 [Synchytrium endobioticum]
MIVQGSKPGTPPTNDANSSSTAKKPLNTSREFSRDLSREFSRPGSFSSENRDAPTPNSVDEMDLSLYKVTNAIPDVAFTDAMRAAGWSIRRMCEDGACLFRAVADQMYGTQDRHLEVRQACMDHLAAHEAFFSAFLTDTETYAAYIRRKRHPHAFGNALEIQAMADMYNVAIEIYEAPRIDPFVITPSTGGVPATTIRVSYHRGIHYNSVHPAQDGSCASSEQSSADVSGYVSEDEFVTMQKAMLEDIARSRASADNSQCKPDPMDCSDAVKANMLL